MVYRDRQDFSPSTDVNQSSSKNRDRYLDNCFLLCINHDDDRDTPEIHRLENNLMRELCQKNPTNQIKPHHHHQHQRVQKIDDDDDDVFDNEVDIRKLRQQKERDYYSRGKGHVQDKDFHSRYQRDENHYNHNPYSRTPRFNNYRNDYNIMQHSDDELSVYEVYIPTNTLNRLSDKRIDNNMVLIDYEDVSTLRDIQGPPTPYGYPTRNLPTQYNNYGPSNQYNDYGVQYPYDLPSDYTKERNDQQPFYSNNLLQQQQRFGGYYGPETERNPYPPQAGPYVPENFPIDRSNAINVRRHIYSPSQLPQGLTEAQLVMLLQKGNQYQQMKPMPTQNEIQPTTTTSAVTVTQQPSTITTNNTELFKNPEYAAPLPTPIKNPQVASSTIVDDEKKVDTDEKTQPMSTLNPPTKSSKDIEIKLNDDKKKEKKSDKDIGDSAKKDSKKDSKKKKK